VGEDQQPGDVTRLMLSRSATTTSRHAVAREQRGLMMNLAARG
jgi:hypothetical protein